MNLTLLGSIFPQRDPESSSVRGLAAWARIAPNCPIIETYISRGNCGDIFVCDDEYIDTDNPPANTIADFDLQAWQSLGRYNGALLVYPYNSARVARLTDRGYLMLCCKKKEDDTPLTNYWVSRAPTNLVTVGWMKTRPKYMGPTIYIYRVVYDPSSNIVYIGNKKYSCDVQLCECPQTAYKTLLEDNDAEVILNTTSGLFLLKGGVDYGSVNGGV